MKKVLLAIVAVAVGCSRGLSQEEVNAELDRYVAERNQCTIDDDCALVTASCPLPCFVAVTRGQEADVREKAEALTSEPGISRGPARTRRRALARAPRCSVSAMLAGSSGFAEPGPASPSNHSLHAA